MSNLYFGKVVDISTDPLKIGRVKVRVYGVYDQIATDDLPWAICFQPMQSAAAAGIGSTPTGIALGSEVGVMFADDAMQIPFVIGTFAGQNDVSALATGENTVTRSLQMPFEPKSSYAAKYPDNKAITTKSGHVIEIDDTDGAERIHVHHKSGSYIEMRPNGAIVIKAIDDKFELVAGDRFEFTKGNITQHTAGNLTFLVKGVANIWSTSKVDIRAPEIHINQSLPVGQVGEVIELEDEADRDEEFAVDNQITLNDYQAVVTSWNAANGGETITVEDSFNIDKTIVDRAQTLVYPDCGIYDEDSVITSSTSRISIADLTTNVVTTGHSLPAVSKSWAKVGGSITKGNIICNLVALSHNVILPIFDEFGRNYFGQGEGTPVNSGYRSTTGSSWHNGGCAVDLQISGSPNAIDTSDVIKWIINNVNFDTVFLEYSSQYFPNAWIHVSYNRLLTKQRKLVRTIDTRTGSTVNGIVILR